MHLRPAIAVLPILALLFAGCAKTDSTSAGSGKGDSASVSGKPSPDPLVGVYKGEPLLPQNATEEQKTQHAAAKAMLEGFGGITLTIKPGNEFELTLMNIPSTGKFTMHDDHLHLKIEKVSGMTPEEFDKAAKKSEDGMTITLGDDFQREMEGNVRKDGQEIVLNAPNGKESEAMLFVRVNDDKK